MVLHRPFEPAPFIRSWSFSCHIIPWVRAGPFLLVGSNLEGELGADVSARFALCPADATQESYFGAGDRGVVRDRDRGQLRHFQRSRCTVVASPSLPAS